MQSQLEAALLGHSSNTVLNTVDEDDNEEETEDVEDFIEEEVEGDNGNRIIKQIIGKDSHTRTVTLQMLLSAGILEPGPGFMTIEYLGQRFVGDLLEDGKIKSQETDIVFASPSAWAIACKRFINPDKKSGCGWASVKYRGKKLDAYKNIWYKKKKEDERIDREVGVIMEQAVVPPKPTIPNSMMYPRIVVKHNTVANRTLTHDANAMIECIPFSTLGKIQPFLVSLSTNAAILMDFHCHLTKSEVSGYLAGSWDVNTHNLQITHSYPCRNTKSDRDNAHNIESEIAKTIEKEKLTLVGWYHSHPFAAAAPTLRDVDAQLDYQIRMKGTTDNSYTPCIGIIISPYNYENNSLESNIIAYWVTPPPETKPNEYGRPMLMSYSVVQDSLLTPYIKDEIVKCVEYYKKENDFVNFNEAYLGNTLFIEKLKSTLIAKFPRDESETALWRLIRENLGCTTEEKETLISIPSVSKASQIIPSLNPPVSLSSGGIMLPSDISGLLFNSGKFPSASSLLGLPDPMAHSTLAANNMFLSTNLFKMQELLKPLSTSSPLPSKSSKEPKPPTSSPLKIPTDLKGIKSPDFQMDFLKNKLEFATPELSLPKMSTGKEYSAIDYLASFKNKPEFSVPDLSMTKSLSDYSLNLSKSMSSVASDLGEKMAKIPKLDYSAMLDLSMSKNSNLTESASETATDLSVSFGDTTSNVNKSSEAEEKPLNLAGE